MASSTILHYLSLSLNFSFSIQFFPSSIHVDHLFRDRPLDLVSVIPHSAFRISLSVLNMSPHHLILCALIKSTTSSKFMRIHHVPASIFLNSFLSKHFRSSSSFLHRVHLSQPQVLLGFCKCVALMVFGTQKILVVKITLFGKCRESLDLLTCTIYLLMKIHLHVRMSNNSLYHPSPYSFFFLFNGYCKYFCQPLNMSLSFDNVMPSFFILALIFFGSKFLRLLGRFFFVSPVAALLNFPYLIIVAFSLFFGLISWLFYYRILF